MHTGSILAGSVVLLSVIFLIFKRPGIAFAYSFLLVTFVSKTISVVFLDVKGPIFAEQLGRKIGGGWAAIPFSALIMLSLIPAWFILNSKRLQSHRGNSTFPQAATEGNSTRGFTIGDAAFVGISVFVALLYIDMLLRGVIPILDGIERFDYATQYAGGGHRFLFKYGPLIAMWCGVFFMFPAIHGRSLDWRFLGALIFLLGYAFITGHRFSAFYSFSTFFLLPLAAIFIGERTQRGRDPISPDKRKASDTVRRSLIVLAVISVLLIVMIVIALANSYLNVRDFSAEETLRKLLQRIFIQPSELWYATWERVMLRDDWDGSAAYQFMFNDAIEPARNTGIQYLMLLELGYGRTTELLGMGSQYAGGYPEILFELLGPYAPFIMALLLGIVTAWLARMLLLAIIRGHFISVFWISYVYFAVCLIYIGGMLNFLVVTTFWIKMFGMVFSVLAENHLERHGLHLLPWMLIRGNANGLNPTR